MTMQMPRGTRDALPGETYLWQKIEAIMRDICAQSGFLEIRTPTFEHTELFSRGAGEGSDVVRKEMYTFLDKGGRSITLKPEGTAGVARAFLEHNLGAQPLPAKLYYLPTPIFRYDAPQAGRYREHHQFGIEVFGATHPICDAEVIALAHDTLRAVGITKLKASINSIGCKACRPAYRDALRAFFAPKIAHMCGDCKDRFEKNPLRILDCKVPDCKAAAVGAPVSLGHLCDECSGHFAGLTNALDVMGIEYEIDTGIVRGLDYYTRTVFEFLTTTENGSLAVCAGGRYDGLIEEIGGPPTPGMGFGMGMERLIMLIDNNETARTYDAFICTLGDEARLAGVTLARDLRNLGIRADIDVMARSLKAQFKYADKTGAPYVIVIGQDELNSGIYKLRDMAASGELSVPRGQIGQIITQALKEQSS